MEEVLRGKSAKRLFILLIIDGITVAPSSFSAEREFEAVATTVRKMTFTAKNNTPITATGVRE